MSTVTDYARKREDRKKIGEQYVSREHSYYKWKEHTGNNNCNNNNDNNMITTTCKLVAAIEHTNSFFPPKTVKNEMNSRETECLESVLFSLA